MNPNNLSENKYFKRGITIIILLIITYLLVPILLTTLALYSSFKNKDSFANCLKELVTVTGPLGDTLGGIMGPLVAIIAALLTYWAFMEQVKANKQQANQFTEQFRVQELRDFENRFYETLKLHIENANLINDGVPNKQGKGFAYIFSEIRFIGQYIFHTKYKGNAREISDFREKVRAENIDKSIIDEEITRIELLVTLLMHMGNPKSSFTLPPLLANLNVNYLDFESLYSLVANSTPENPPEINSIADKNLQMLMTFELFNKDFTLSGHFNSFNRYLTSLNLLISLVRQQNDDILSPKVKEEYFSTIRSVIGREELYVLYILSFTTFCKVSFENIVSSRLFYELQYAEIDFTFRADSYFKYKLGRDYKEDFLLMKYKF